VAASDSLARLIPLLMKDKGNRVLAVRDIHERLPQVTAEVFDRDEVALAVEKLELGGVIVPVRGKRYSLLEFTSFVSGKLRIFNDGHGSIFRTRELPEVYIDRRGTKGAMNDDLVLVRIDREKDPSVIRGRTYVIGEVQRILRREHRTVVGRFFADNPPFVRPFDEKLDADISIDPEGTLDARDGEMVNVEIERYSERSQLAYGRVIETLGFIGEPGVDIEVVIRKFHLPHQFTEDVIAEAEEISQEIPAEELAKRVDLRDRTIVTIDGETAKDFDDAVEVIRLPNGNFRLGVHIADVSHYVPEGGRIDVEAYERATSVYFPGRAIPMLPERLSNGICSLNPQVDRLTFSAEIEIDARGRFVNRKFYKSVIRTRERMTYTNVHLILSEKPPELMERYAPLIPEFERMFELFEVLRKRREARGSIDFDLPEAEVLLSIGGEIETIAPSERNVAHRIIEEFMLAANEVVAQQLVFSNQPGMYRVHHPPDAQKIEDLKEILLEFRHKLRADPEEIKPGELQRVLKEVAGTPEQRFLTELVLRSMKRAIYSEESQGHFALGLQHYCHFTSPIRRYPDLIVHRRLHELLLNGAAIGEQLEMLEAQHPKLALQSSERERRADQAEREVLEWKKVIFMKDKVGREFEGTVTGVVPFGLFVELKEFFVQGLVPVASVGGDFWLYSEKEHRLRGESSRREFRLGDSVTVEIWAISEEKRQIELRLVAASGERVVTREESGPRAR